MTEIVIGAPTFHALLTALKAETERGAALYLSYDGESDRYLIRGAEVAGEADRISASELEITFSPLFLTRITRHARERSLHLALLHTHPEGCDSFSSVDDDTEHGLAAFMKGRNPTHQAFSMVLCGGKIKARRFGTREAVPVRYVGSEIKFFDRSASEPTGTERYDRQVRAFGVKGQAALHRLTVAIVGLGGTGSVAAQQLAYLGVGKFVLIDPDTVDETNLNRVVGAYPAFTGRNKTDVASDVIGHVNPQARVDRYANSVISEQGRRLLCSADCIFICTDSHVSRAFLSEFCYQYLIPAFDIGVSINAQGGAVQAITGRTQMLAPGLPCLLCSNSLDARVIREELMTPEQREMDPYFNGDGIKQPAVISLNSTMVSLSITMFLSAFTGIPTRARWQSYDGLTGGVRALGTQSDPECPICGAGGLLASGDSRLLNFLPASAA